MSPDLARSADRKPPGKSWPLLTLAVLSFIPGFGFIIAAAALSWALVSNRPKAKLAGILAAAGALAQLGLGLVLLVRQQDKPETRVAQRALTGRDLAKVVAALEDYHAEHHAYPARLDDLIGYPIPTRFVNILDNSSGFFKLNEKYIYVLAPNSNSYDLYARGPDGKAGTDDDIRPRLSDSLLTHSGYRPQ
ncbi:MAG TPA: type II secretion system protein GspG [Gemmatimonadales bacterium]|nr:type II secretion system protein GspG [Gemmatimonadales bacterium]